MIRQTAIASGLSTLKRKRSSTGDKNRIPTVIPVARKLFQRIEFRKIRPSLRTLFRECSSAVIGEMFS